ncbi:helix-turn-helix domain-containing protein [Oceanobacillus sp. FSL K6-0118]|uniref:helix-turn-helix domain-containing protein n=1 Tax=Oceanobacillus sp. FSL K6-0118 TaxID=2921418 RepID=UPI0030FB3AF8
MVKTFSTTLKKLNLKPADLGAIYKLLPYVHYETNLVCKNPFEVNPKNVEFCNKTELAELIGISRSKASEVLAELTRAGVIIEIKRKASLMSEAQGDGRETVVALNPSIVSRLQGEHENIMLLQLFNNADY